MLLRWLLVPLQIALVYAGPYRVDINQDWVSGRLKQREVNPVAPPVHLAIQKRNERWTPAPYPSLDIFEDEKYRKMWDSMSSTETSLWALCVEHAARAPVLHRC